MKSRMLRGFVTTDPMPTRREQRIWAVVLGISMFLFLTLLSLLFTWLAPEPPPLQPALLLAAGIAAVAGLGAWQRGRKLPRDLPSDDR